MAIVNGTDTWDVLFGTTGSDQIYGNKGDDTLIGGKSADTLDGGEGLDTVQYDEALEFAGLSGPDVTLFGANVDLSAGTGTVKWSVGGVVTTWTDTLIAVENIVGSRLNDTILGDGGNNQFFANNGDDILKGGGGNDWLAGEDGNDTISGGRGSDTISGGAGQDTADYTGEYGTYNVGGGYPGSAYNTGVIVDLATGKAQINYVSGHVRWADIDTLGSIENLIGTANDDFLHGDGAANEIFSGEGGDWIEGKGGADNLAGQGGDDRLNGGDGNDTINGGEGNDMIVAAISDGNDLLTGGEGFDVLDYSGVGGVVQVNQLAGTATGSAGNDTLADVFEQVIGSGFNDVLSGGHGVNILDGMGGDDQLFGNNGDDLVRGGEGNDRLYASISDGNDRLYGGAGNDTFYIAHMDGNDSLRGDGGFDILDFSAVGGVVQVNQLAGTTAGSAGKDTLLDVFEQVIGTNFGDVLSGGHGVNALIGGGGNDTIFGNNGDDYISGGLGADTIYLGVGNDTLDFRNGDGIDTVKDFVAGGSEDRIGLGNYSGLGFSDFAGLQASGRLSTVNGQAELLLNGGDKVIFENVASHTQLTAADFTF